MVKLVGAVCILGAGTWAWRRSAAERRRELDTLADLTAPAGPHGGEEIRLRRTSLPSCWGPWAGTGRDLSGTLVHRWRRRWRGARPWGRAGGPPRRRAPRSKRAGPP